MSVRTKTPPTDAQCTLAFLGPAAQAEAARAALQALGFRAVEGDTTTALPVPWREAFPPLDDAARPGRMLRAARTKEDLSQMQLAARTGIPQRHLSAMEQGKRTIGKARARQLAAVLQVDYRLLL